MIRSANAGSQGELVEAVRSAFIFIEEEVRAAGGFQKSDYGIDLMRKAFDATNGPLGDHDQSKPKGERDALAHLFAGAIGRFKNPVSHGSPPLTLPEAQDQMLLASHLLRILDQQRLTRS